MLIFKFLPLNGITLNILRNLLPNKYVTCDHNFLIWKNENIKSKIKTKNELYHVYAKICSQETDFCALEESVRNLKDLILQTKTCYYKNLEKKLNCKK